MRSSFLLPLLLIFGSFSVKAPSFIDPTGTYRLKGKVKNNQVTGHSGELRVRLLDQRTVALCFYMNAGYPGYQSGSLLDTFSYQDNTVLYQPVRDTSCAVYFTFDGQKVGILQVMSDPRSGCGFAPGVFVPVSFPKVSGDVPVIQNLDREGR